MQFFFPILIIVVFFIIFIVFQGNNISKLVDETFTLPSLNQLNKYNPDESTDIISADQFVIKQLYMYSSKREAIDITDVPKHLTNALIIMEDREFYSHNGINIKATFRALLVDLLTLSTKQGASTITQQLARNMYNDPDNEIYIGAGKNITRKLKELLTAIKIERTYTKQKIIELYLNSVYFGHGNYGIQSASKYYFGKDVEDLSLNECSILIGLLPAPARFSPKSHPERSIKRRELVISKMYEHQLITKEEYYLTIEQPLPSKSNTIKTKIAPYFSEYVRRELEEISRKKENINIYKDGLSVNTTLDFEIQNILNDVFNETMLQNQNIFNKEILNNQLKLDTLAKEFSISIDSLKVLLSGDVELPRIYRKKLLVQGAVIVLDSEHGHILAMIGGRNEPEYIDHFNRSTQAIRQPGSVFKPFIYLSALENGATPCTQLLNQPLVFFLEDDKSWNPQNWDQSVGGLTTLRHGLKESLNLISVRVVHELVTPKQVKQTSNRFKFTTPIKEVSSIALGVSEVKLLDITSAYAAISNSGILVEPIGITSIEDNTSRKIAEFYPKSEEVANEDDIYILRDMMKSVIKDGTGRKIRWKYNFMVPAAGKTGTTNKKTDAWFVGFTPQLTIGVWVGLDDPSMRLGKSQYGSKAALPIFAKAMNRIYDREFFVYNNRKIFLDSKLDWEIPSGIIRKSVCKSECCLDVKHCQSVNEYFKFDNIPVNECSKQPSNPLQRFQ